MRNSRFGGMAIAVLTCLVAMDATAEAQHADWTSIQADFASLRSENDDLRYRLSSLERSVTHSSDATSLPYSEGCSRLPAYDTCCPPVAVWSAGSGVYFVKPYWESNPTRGRFFTAGNPSTYSQDDFDWDTEAAWDVWLEYVAPSGLGIRTRYWQFDHATSSTPVTSQDPSDAVVLPRPLGIDVDAFNGPHNFTFSSGLEIDVVDVEALQRLQGRNWQWELVGGLRYASVEQNYAGARLAPAPVPEIVEARHDFDGIGPLVGLEGRRRLGDTGLSLFGKGRAAILFGNTDEAATRRIISVDQVRSSGEASRWDTLPVVEIEFGAAYETDIGAMTAFIEAAWVGYVWFGAGNSSNTGPLAAGGPSTITNQPILTSNNNDNLGLMGGRLSVGLRF